VVTLPCLTFTSPLCVLLYNFKINFVSELSRQLIGIALGYGTDGRGFRVPSGAGKFSLHHRVQSDFGVHPASYPVGTRGSFPGMKRPGRETDHSLQPSTKFKNVWSYTSIPSTPSWRGAQLRKAKEQIYFYFYRH
jgi:hypothetical protein